MSTSWTDVFPNLDRPVLGQPEDYDRAEQEVGGTADAVRLVSDEFRRIKSLGCFDELRGKVADQLRILLGNVDEVLYVVPDVLADVERIFREHARELKALEGRADRALELARQRKEALEAARASEQGARDALWLIDSQIDELRYSASPVEVVEIERERLEDRQWRQQGVVDAKVQATSSAEGLLADSRNDFWALKGEEDQLVIATRKALEAIDMRGLEDPNPVLEWLGEQVSGLTEFVNTFLAADSLLDYLWAVSDALDAVLLVLAVVAVAATVAIMVAASGGAALALAPALLTFAHSAGLALGAVKLVIDTGLLATQAPHPVTGKTMTWSQVLVQAALLGFNAKMGPGILKTPFHRLSVGRRWVQQALLPRGAGGQLLKLSSHGNAQYAIAHKVLTAGSADIVQEVGKHVISEELPGLLSKPDVRPQPLSTDPGEWADLVPFVQSSPVLDGAENELSRQSDGLRQFTAHGPSFSDSAPVYQLAVAA